MSYRDMGCGEPRAGDAERMLTLSGWVGRRRDHGGLIFIDLRDRIGRRPARDRPRARAGGPRDRAPAAPRGGRARARRARAAQRGDAQPALATGDVELSVTEIELLAPAEALPFQLDDENVDETLRIHHRYLDLRRPTMQRIQKIRVGRHPDHAALPRGSRVLGARDADADALARPRARATSSCRHGSRPGSFYALPQSPQLFKQLLMVAGYDRYYQIARCFRDEAQRADRQLEFTQLDIEMSFVEREDVLTLCEGLYAEIWRRSPASSSSCRSRGCRTPR